MVPRHGNGRESSKQQSLSAKCLFLKREFVGPLDQLTGDATILCSLELDRPGDFAVILRERNRRLALHNTFRLFDERTGSLGGDLGEKDKRPRMYVQCSFIT